MDCITGSTAHDRIVTAIDVDRINATDIIIRRLDSLRRSTFKVSAAIAKDNILGSAFRSTRNTDIDGIALIATHDRVIAAIDIDCVNATDIIIRRLDFNRDALDFFIHATVTKDDVVVAKRCSISTNCNLVTFGATHDRVVTAMDNNGIFATDMVIDSFNSLLQIAFKVLAAITKDNIVTSAVAGIANLRNGNIVVSSTTHGNVIASGNGNRIDITNSIFNRLYLV